MKNKKCIPDWKINKVIHITIILFIVVSILVTIFVK